MNTNKEFKITASENDCFDYWLDDNLGNLKYSKFAKYILAVKNKNRDLINVFKKIYDETALVSINWIEAEIDTDYDIVFSCYEEETEKRTEKFEEWIEKHTIEIETKWYCQSDWDTYIIFIKNKKFKKQIEKELNFLKKIMTITEKRIGLEERDVIEKGGKSFYTDRQTVESFSTHEDSPDIEKISLELCNDNNIDTNKISIPEEIFFIG